jgi:hypothetical protein
LFRHLELNSHIKIAVQEKRHVELSGDLMQHSFGRQIYRNIKSKFFLSRTKLRIQTEFRKKLGLIIDVPKQNSGNSNDGNTARRFFLPITQKK